MEFVMVRLALPYANEGEERSFDLMNQVSG
jgi:hypothetical protein